MPYPILRSIAALALLLSTSSTPSTSSLESVLNKVVLYANVYNIDFAPFYLTIECESAFDPTRQSDFLDKNGKREESYGLAQINLPWNPSVTREEALDPDFALNFMAAGFAGGRANQWSCYNILKANGKI